MEGKIIQAIDIGTTKVAAVVARETPNKKLEILGVGTSPSFGVIRADIVNISMTIEAIQKAVKEAEEQSGIPFTEVYVGIAGSHIGSQQHRAVLMRPDYNEVISQKDIDSLKSNTKRLAINAGEMIIEILPQDFKVDTHSNIINPIGMIGNSIEANMHIITGSEIAVNNIKRCVAGAGLKVKKVVMQPIASAAAVLSADEMESGVALIDIGGGTTDIAIFVDGIIGHTAVIPFGGEIITEDIKQGCKILKQTAESIKVQHGSTFPSKEHENTVITIPGLKDRPHREISMRMLVEIIQARMEEILDAVFNEIKMSGLDSRINSGIVLTGGGSQLKFLKQLTAYLSGYDIRMGIPDEHLSKTKIKNVNNPIYSTAIGLLLQGLKEDEKYPQSGKSVDNDTDVEKVQGEKKTKKTILEGENQRKETEPVEEEIKPRRKSLLEKIYDKANNKLKGFIENDDVADFHDNLN